jgi:hypothetical protein
MNKIGEKEYWNKCVLVKIFSPQRRRDYAEERGELTGITG